MKNKNENQIKKFIDDLKLKEKSKATIEKYERDVKKFINFADGKINKDSVLKYKEHLKKEYKIKSANSMIASLNSFFIFIKKHKLKAKYFILQKETFRHEDKELLRSDYEILIEEAKKRENKEISFILQTICSTGIRISELSFITVESVKKAEAVINLKGKVRRIFILPKLCKKLLEYANEKNVLSGSIFVTKRGLPISRVSVWKKLKRLAKSAKVKESKVFPHNLRRLFAKCFYENEKDVIKLADLLGHSNVNTTRIYLQSAGKEHRKMLEGLNLLD